MKANKNKRIEFRLTSEKYELIKHRSNKFGSITNFINHAIDEFSDATEQQQIDISNRLIDLYASIDSKLAHVGGNLNQAMRRINETAAAGQPFGVLLKAELAPKIDSVYELCRELRIELMNVTLKHTK